MIHIFNIYNKNETNFETFGLASLIDVSNPSIRQKINAEYSLTFEYPLTEDDDKVQYIEKENIIKVEKQLFRIREIEKIDTGYTQWIKVYADHVFFDLIDYWTEDKRAVDTSVQVALEILLQGTPFKVGLCDDLGIATAYFIEENKLKSINDKIIPRWNCEIEIDNYTVTAKKRIGKDRNYRISRGKNLKGVNYHEDVSNVVTRLYAKGYDGLTFEDINDGKKYVDSPLISKYAHIKAGDHHFDDIEDKKELLDAAKEHVLTIDKPYIHYDIDLVELRDSDDYKHYRDLEVFGLGDTVQVYNDKLDIDINARILEYEYNPIRRQNSVVVLGNFTQRLEDTLGQFEDTKRKVDNSITDDGYVRTNWLQGEINALTNKIVASGAYHHAQVIEDEGLLFENVDETSNDFGAMYIGPGIFAIASSKKSDGSWDWATFGTGKGFTADLINAGLIRAQHISVGSQSSFEDGYNPIEKETPDGAQSKADNALNAAKTYANSEFKVRDEIIASKVEQRDFDGAVKQITSLENRADALEIISGEYKDGKLVGLTYTFDGKNFTIGGQGGDVARHTNSSSRYEHTDGSYTRIGSNGIRRYVAGTGHTYHYLIHITTFTIGTSSGRWIQLPDEFKGKGFSVYAAMADSLQTPENKLASAIHRFVVTGTPGEKIDYANARVPITGYKLTIDLDDNYRRSTSEVQGMLIAIY